MEIIRRARLNDAKSINLLSLHMGYGRTSDDIAIERLKCLLNSVNDCVWVFEDESRLIGWIHVFKAYRVASSAFNEIGGLVVDSKFRKKGIGRKLVEFIAKESQAQGSKLRVRFNGQ